MSIYIPKSVELENAVNTVNKKIKATPTWQLGAVSCGGDIDGLEAVKQFIYTQMSIDRYAFNIYDQYVGNELYTLLGKGMDYAKAEIPRMVKECLLFDDRVLSIDSFIFKQDSIDSLSVTFTVHTIYGDTTVYTNTVI